MAENVKLLELRSGRYGAKPMSSFATHHHYARHRLVVHISRACFMASSSLVILLLLIMAGVASNTPLPPQTSPSQLPASKSYSNLTVRALLERANLTWPLLFKEQQEALSGIKSLIEAKNIIDCYAKHVQFNLNQQQKALQVSNRTRVNQRTSNSSQLAPTFLTNNGSFCVPDLMGGSCFPPHPAGTQYYYMCMDDLELKREILESCPAYNRYSEPAYAARQCNAAGGNAKWSTTIDYDSTRSVMLPNGTMQPVLPCYALLERCYSSGSGNLGGELGAPGDDLLNTHQQNNDLKRQKDSAGGEASCSAKKSDTVRQIASLVALLDLCFSSISFVLLCVTLFIFLFFKSLHCGRISIHTNLAASLLLRTALHIMFMTYKLFMDYSRRVRNEEHAAAVAEAAAAATPVSDAGDMIESLGIGSIASFVNDDDVELISSRSNSSHILWHHDAQTTTTPASAILDTVLTGGANLLMSESATHTLNATLAILQHHNASFNATPFNNMPPQFSPIWQMSDGMCKLLLAVYMYSTVASVLWMFIEGFHLSQRIALSVFRRETNFLLFYFIGWILPLIFVLAWVGAMEFFSTQCYCWSNYDQSGWKWLVAGPMISALIVNAFFLIAIITIVITKLQANDTAEMAQVRKALKATIILFPLLGVSFLFSAFNPNDDGVGESAYFISNAVLQGSQGIFVAVIYCFCNSEVHQAVKRYYYRILLRRGDYRRSSRIAMTLMDGNTGQSVAERRKSSAAPLVNNNNIATQITLRNNNYGTEQLSPLTAAAVTPPQQLNSNFPFSDANHHVNSNHVNANHVNIEPNSNHVVAVSPSSPNNSSHHSVSPPPQPMFRYRLASYAANQPAAVARVASPTVSTIAPLSSSAEKIANHIVPESAKLSATDQVIADIDDDDEQETVDENTAELQKLNNSARNNVIGF